MSHPLYHSKSSARKYGGDPSDYQEIHNFFDQTKAHLADARHRLLLHNSFGIFLVELVFGLKEENKQLRKRLKEHGIESEDLKGLTYITRESDSKEVPIRIIGEQHILEDFSIRTGIPTVEKCLEGVEIKPWMYRGARNLSKECL